MTATKALVGVSVPVGSGFRETTDSIKKLV